MTDTHSPSFDAAIRRLETCEKVARTMLKALIAVAHDRNTPTDLRGMAFAVIKQAEAAGITTGEDNADT